MNTDRASYTACVGESCIARDVPYDTLLIQIMEYTARAATARTVDENDWEQDQLRRKGLASLDIFRGGRAVWADPQAFQEALAGARGNESEPEFESANELDESLYDRLDRDLRERWRRLGYQVFGLRKTMKKLFTELEGDAVKRSALARKELIEEVVRVASSRS